MMYTEFLAGTGCRNNEHNQKLFERLEAMYMNIDISKQEIYEYGKKLADNSLSEEQKAHNEEVRTQIKALQIDLEDFTETAKRYKEYAKDSYTAEDRKYWNKEAKWMQDKAKESKNAISWLKGCIIK